MRSTALTRAFALVAALVSGLDAATAAAQAPGAHVVHLVLSPAAAAVRVGDTVALKALADYSDGTVGVDVTAAVAWSSSDTGVATVAAGVATGVAGGTAAIRATDPASGVQSDASSGALAVVARLSKIALSPSERILPLKRSTLFHAIGTFEHGVNLDISPDVAFASADPTIATIAATGRARGKALGTTHVTATDVQTGISTTVPLTVVGALQRIGIAQPSTALAVGGSALLKATGVFAGDCHGYNYGSRLKWASSDPAVATIDNEGNLRCLADGAATISVRDRPSGITSTESAADAAVVCGGNPTAIVVSPEFGVVPSGMERDLVATYVFPGGIQADGTRQVAWSSDQPAVARIVAASGSVGKAVGGAPGTASIVAFDAARNLSSASPGGRNGVIHVPGAPLSFKLAPTVRGTAASGPPGSELRLTARLGFADGTHRDVNKLVAWSSSNPAVVALSDGSTCAPLGTFALLAPGSAVVSAVYPKEGGPGALTTSLTVSVNLPPTPTPRPTPTPTPYGSASRAFFAPTLSLLD